MMATVPHVTSGSGLRKFQAGGFLLDSVYTRCILSVKDSFKNTNACYLAATGILYFFQGTSDNM